MCRNRSNYKYTQEKDKITYFKHCKNCPYVKVTCVSEEEEIYRWECPNGIYVDLHSWEKPYPYDFGYKDGRCKHNCGLSTGY